MFLKVLPKAVFSIEFLLASGEGQVFVTQTCSIHCRTFSLANTCPPIACSLPKGAPGGLSQLSVCLLLRS